MSACKIGECAVQSNALSIYVEVSMENAEFKLTCRSTGAESQKCTAEGSQNMPQDNEKGQTLSDRACRTPVKWQVSALLRVCT